MKAPHLLFARPHRSCHHTHCGGEPDLGTGALVTFPADQEEFGGVCPYLGLADDADSHATYATEAHRCYRLPNPTRIATGHQETYCLGANHVSCPVYLGEGVPGAAAPAAAATAAGAAAAPTAPTRAAGAPTAPRGPQGRDL